ncbi:uncharacterized protein EI90DRAFT_3020069 [Cantharellus anzutake]|uniref:uncharacterized protein n=1 Tax=Cantharellus anzutake TaxID=1750568 RepID=UPI00190564DF|nr:uncharacterized protein EI90DRAFT_3020069 [Cantharellus anzutake]KAF8322403.1 hypothetical protein EI90DRAFT_3020069 [Cantharellus anzutake]
MDDSEHIESVTDLMEKSRFTVHLRVLLIQLNFLLNALQKYMNIIYSTLPSFHQKDKTIALSSEGVYHLKYDDVEIPGHHLEHKDSYPDFITIARFSPTVHLCCGNSFCFRQITFIGHDHDGFKRPLSRFVSHALSSDGYSDEGKSEKDSNIPHPDCTAHDALAKTARG